MNLPYINSVAEQPAETYFERTIANLRNALLEHPEDELQLKQQILFAAQETEKEDKVIDLAQELIAIDIDKIYADDCFLILARMYDKKKETTEAIKYYRKAFAANPELDEAIIELAELYINQFKYDDAIAVYDNLDSPHFIDIKDEMYRYKGECYYKKNEYEKALECFQKSFEIDSDDATGTLINNIGGCFFNMGNFTEAFSWFRKSLEKNPQSAIAHYGLGLCYRNTDDGYRALHHYFEAIKIKPDYSEAYNNMSVIIVDQESDYNSGIEMLNKAMSTCQDQNLLANIYLNLSRIYNRLCEYTLADHYKAQYMKCWGFDGLFEEDDED